MDYIPEDSLGEAWVEEGHGLLAGIPFLVSNTSCLGVPPSVVVEQYHHACRKRTPGRMILFDDVLFHHGMDPS